MARSAGAAAVGLCLPATASSARSRGCWPAIESDTSRMIISNSRFLIFDFRLDNLGDSIAFVDSHSIDFSTHSGFWSSAEPAVISRK